MTDPRTRYYEEQEVGSHLAAVAKRCVCECGAGLVILMQADADGVVHHHLRCGNGHVDPAYVPTPSTYQLWAQGLVEVPPYLEQHYLKFLQEEMDQMIDQNQTPAVPDQATLTQMARRPFLTEAEAIALLQMIWPDAPPLAKKRAALLCLQYKLNPLRKHVALVKFQTKQGDVWEPILTIEASRIIAQEEGGRYSYVKGPRMMNAPEMEDILGFEDSNNYWAITELKDAQGNLYPGYGSWPKRNEKGEVVTVYGGDKGNTPQNMAMVRSERNALKKLAPGRLPDEIEVYDSSALPGWFTPLELTASKEAPKATAPIAGRGQLLFEWKKLADQCLRLGIEYTPLDFKTATIEEITKSGEALGEAIKQHQEMGQGGAEDDTGLAGEQSQLKLGR